MTNGQSKDLETVRFFIPLAMLPSEGKPGVDITDRDVVDFFEYSEEGKHAEKVGLSTMDGFNALVQGKRWRGIHMEMWEEGIMDGTIPYIVLLEGLPDSVVEFMSREMFKGRDKELIYKLHEAHFATRTNG